MYPGFKEAYQSLKVYQLNDFQDEVMLRCGWSLSTFNNKKAGRTQLKILECAKLQQIFRKYDVEVLLRPDETVFTR